MLGPYKLYLQATLNQHWYFTNKEIQYGHFGKIIEKNKNNSIILPYFGTFIIVMALFMLNAEIPIH